MDTNCKEIYDCISSFSEINFHDVIDDVDNEHSSQVYNFSAIWRKLISSNEFTSSKVLPKSLKLAGLIFTECFRTSWTEQENFLKWLSTQIIGLTKRSEYDVLLNFLDSITYLLKDKSDHSEELYIHFGGYSGSLVQVIDAPNMTSNCRLKGFLILHQLTFAPPSIVNDAKLRQSSVYPVQFVASIQKICLNLLKQPLLDDISYEIWLQLVKTSLSVIYNLVICAPDEILGGSIITAAHPFIFHGLDGVKKTDLMFNQDLVNIPSLSEADSNSSTRAYTNRNRRKRLRRKHAQPSQSSKNGSPAQSKGQSSSNVCENYAFIPKVPPSPQSLSEVSLKPEWIQNSKSGENSRLPFLKSMQLHKPNKRENNFLPKKMEKIKDDMEELTLGVSPKFLNEQGKVERLTNFSRELARENSAVKSTESSLVGEGSNDKSISSSIQSISFLEFGMETLSESPSMLEARVRHDALLTINSVIAKCGNQHKFGFWPMLMCQKPSLMSCILKEKNISARMAALQVLETFLTDSHQVLSMAVDTGEPGPYTTLGMQIGTSIRELHRCLILALISEKSSDVLVRILKTMELLIENVKYDKLRPGLLVKIVTHVKYYLRCKEAVVRANAFSVMVSLLMIKPQLPELKGLLLRYLNPAPPNFITESHYDSILSLEEECEGDGESECDTSVHMSTSEEEFSSSDSGVEQGGQKTTMVSWLVRRCIDSLSEKNGVTGIYIQVQLQSFKVLRALVKEHLSLIQCSLPLIEKVISVCCKMKLPSAVSYQDESNWRNRSSSLLQCSNSSFSISDVRNMNNRPSDLSFVSPDPETVIEHSYILLSALLGAVKSQLENVGDEKSADTESFVEVDMAFRLWMWALEDPLQPVLTLGLKDAGCNKNQASLKKVDLNYSLKSLIAASNVFSHLCSCVLERLGEIWLNDILNTILHLLYRKEFELKLSGIQTMAILVSYRTVQEQAIGGRLLLRTVDLCCGILGSSLSKLQINSGFNKDRLLASWALGNISAVLVQYSNVWKSSDAQSVFMSSQQCCSLLQSCIVGCEDKDKIQKHCVRALGNIISWVPSEILNADISEKMNNAVYVLIDRCVKGNNMKIRWNGCNALGSIMGSGNIDVQRAPWRNLALSTLSALVDSFHNYKVRINSCIALCGLYSKMAYGDKWIGTWKSLLKGLEDAQNIVDYKESQHREEFINQLCIGLCQLMLHLEESDVEHISEVVRPHLDTCRALFQRAQKSLPPEKSSIFLKALKHVESLTKEVPIVHEENRCLLEIFSEEEVS